MHVWYYKYSQEPILGEPLGPKIENTNLPCKMDIV